MAPKNLFSLVGDDEVILIFRYLVGFTDQTPLEGNDLRKYIAQTVRTCSALGSTCKYLHGVLLRIDPVLWHEMETRRTLDVRPLHMLNANDDFFEHPFSKARHNMNLEMDTIRLLRKAETTMCFHCAGKHCATARRELQRAACKGGCTVRPITNSRVYNVSTCDEGRRGYVAMRNYDASGAAQDVIRFYDCLGTDGNWGKHEYVLNNIEGFELSPNLMAANPEGLCCAFTFEFDSVPEAGNETANVLYLMSVGQHIKEPHVQRLSPIHAKRYDGVTDMPGVCHAQGVWWKYVVYEESGSAKWYLCVAWSTTLVAGSGHDMHGGAPVGPDERFVIATYEYDQDTCRLEPHDFCGPYHGRLLTCKATWDGTRVACHVRRRPQHKWDMHYIAMTIDITNAQAAEAKHPTIWKCKGKRRMGKDGYDWGPSAVGISPAGDALVCVHRTPGGVAMEVLDLDEGVSYTTTNSRDLTDYFTSTNSAFDDLENMFESESSEDSESDEDYVNKVKLPFDVSFTSTGSHACIVDRRPQFGSRASRYTTALVDLTRRRQVKRMKALPLFQERGSAAKALHWAGTSTLWVQGRRGAVCVDIGGQ